MTIPLIPRVGGADATPLGFVRGGQPTLTWDRQPTTPPTTVVRIQWRAACIDCGRTYWRDAAEDDSRCATCTALAAWRALPWWRRLFTRKPRP